MTYGRLAGMLQGRCKNRKKLENNTWAERDEMDPRILYVRLHRTRILTFHPDGRVRFNTGGWETVTTKDHINSYAPGGWRVYSERRTLYLVSGWSDGRKRFFFFDGIRLTRKDTVVREDARHAGMLERKHKAQAQVRAEYRRKAAEYREKRKAGLVASALQELYRPHRILADAIGEALRGACYDVVKPYLAIEAGLAALGASFHVAREVDVQPPDHAEWAWHFVYGDELDSAQTMNGNLPVRVGQTLHVPAGVSMCGWGLHSSPTPSEAYAYCVGRIVCRVRIWGETDHGPSKSVSEFRHVVWMAKIPERIYSGRGSAFNKDVQALAPEGFVETVPM